MHPTPAEWLAVICFSAALLNALCASKVANFAARAKGSPLLLHFLHHLSEIEVIFGVWAVVYTLTLVPALGPTETVTWFEDRNFSEAIFIIAIMIIASTRPVLRLARQGINSFSRLIPLPDQLSRYVSILILGPLLGSVITEPAAMTVCALLLHNETLPKNASPKLLYSTLAILFVNVSIGGLLTSFAAPPVLMVTQAWNWSTPFMFETFGWKAILAVTLNTIFGSFINAKELKAGIAQGKIQSAPIPIAVTAINVLFLATSVIFSHHPVVLIACFLIFIDYLSLTRAHQGDLKTKSAILVGVFLGGLSILTAEQGFWVRPVLLKLQEGALYLSSIGLTAITDNAALTSLAAKANDLAETSRYSILAGAVAGGGLTLIANAPNPAGFAILKSRFQGPLSATKLFAWALVPTLIAAGILWIHA